jgi:hypothetical protein
VAGNQWEISEAGCGIISPIWMGRSKWGGGKGGGRTVGGVELEVDLLVGRERRRVMAEDEGAREDGSMRD